MPLSFKKFPYIPTLILVALVIRLFTNGLSWVGIVALVISLVWTAIEVVRWLYPAIEPKQEGPATPQKSSNESVPDDLVSLVYFLSEERTPEESTVRDCISSALGISFDPADPEGENFVVRYAPPENSPDYDPDLHHYMVRIPQGNFAVLASGRPYIDNPKQFARESIRDKRLRSVVEEHRAWISIDYMDAAKNPGRVTEAYALIGKVLAAMAGPDCLAIYCPEMQRCNEFDFSLIDSLAGGKPLELFQEPTFEPIIEISDKNPRMAAAVKEANKRWPEFVDAFQTRDDFDGDRFIAKVEFREGDNCEYMWVAISDISGDTARGQLMNDPHELLDIHRGSEVEFTTARLNDWIYPDPEDGSHIGGFTLDVLAESDED